MLFVFFLLIAQLAAANADYYDDTTQSHYYKEQRVLGTSKFVPYNKYVNQPYVSNGYIGARIPNVGFGFTYDQNENLTSSDLSNGWPLFNPRYSGAFIAGFYDAQKNTTGTNFPELLENGYESVISAVPQWTDLELVVSLDGSNYLLSPKTTNSTTHNITNYQQNLDMWTGTVSTSYTWLDRIDVNVSVIAHRQIETLGLVRLELSSAGSASPVNVSVSSILDFESAQRCNLETVAFDESGIYITVQPQGVEYKHATLYSTLVTENQCEEEALVQTPSSVRNTVLVSLDKPVTVTKYVGVVSDDLFSSNSTSLTFDRAKETALNASHLSWDALYELQRESWREIWGQSAVEVENDPYLTLAAEASVYHLLASTRSSSKDLTAAISVGGLSSDSYAGLVFWDADLWMLPALLPVAPDTNAAHSSYRYYLHEQAKKNAEQYGYPGSVYSWTSGRFGNCTGTGPCVNYEYHLNGAICYSIWKSYLSGAIDDDHLEKYGWPILKDTAAFFADYVQFNDTLQKYTTHNLTDPDEYANFKNNAAYTAVLISQVMKWTSLVGQHLGKDVDPKQTHVMENMYLPQSADNITLEYDTMNSSISIKQADVVLITYVDDEDTALLDYFDYDDERATRDLVYYSQHQSSQGPAMTFPVFTGVSQKLNTVGCGSQTYLEKSIVPFLRFPFAQLSEQNNDNYDVNGGTHPAFPFNTGHGGLVQTYYFGLTGIRFGYNVTSDGSISRVLHFDPVELPLLAGDLKITGFKYLNESLDITVGNETATIYHCGDSETIVIHVDDRNEASGVYHLQPGHSLTVPVVVTGENMAGSLSECQAFPYELTTGRDGDVVLSIIDGDNSTTWQAQDKQSNARLLVDLGQKEKFNSGAVIWGDRLPFNFSVSIVSGDVDTLSANITIEEPQINAVVKSQEVKISSPYNASDSEVRITELNSTLFEFSQTFESQYVLLEIYGSLTEDDEEFGGTVAEFNLFNQ
ncbi:hypothetical protein OGAPHI_006507 [Ogataea philodendri]|uniref:alpha,alpha-trehalase n=1 Tax=Ogataea philodendri TaxID=1378263 RepID=A0A9P8NY83_9ASCO|nr:uncharacterized protein OGAPHI_006507 [Ogataea philodendri]KAH3661657.1 hypothetical protein OGAPHI_006507 [Ogataea philodendri]